MNAKNVNRLVKGIKNIIITVIIAFLLLGTAGKINTAHAYLRDIITGVAYSGWNAYTMGYRFTPVSSGTITQLWCYSGGASTVYLWNDAGSLLTSKAITCNGAWVSGNITPVAVTAGQYYRVAVSPGNYGTTSSPLPPQTTTGITINGTYYSTAGLGVFPDAGPFTTVWYGLADVTLAVTNTPPTVAASSPPVSYSSYTRTGPNNNTFYLMITHSDAEQSTITYYVHTGANRTGTQITTGSIPASGGTSIPILYNTSGLVNGTNTLYVSVYDGTSYSSQNPSFTVYRDDNAPTASTSISTNPSNVTSNNQYTVTFTPHDDLSTNSNEMAYQIRTASSGGGTLLTSGTATSNSSVTTTTITDSGLSWGSNTRYIRTRDGANNWYDTSFTVTKPGASCTSTACGTTSSGSTCTTYSVSAPTPCGTACPSALVSTCNNGSWSPQDPYNNTSCTACCNIPWGGTKTQGQTITAYSSDKAFAPTTCSSISQTRTCQSTGAFDGTYANQSCTDFAAACSFPAPVAAGGVFTISSSCSLGATEGKIDGVMDNNTIASDASNSAALVIGPGVTLTIGGGNNQTLIYGQIKIQSGGSIVIAKGVGAQLVKGVPWVKDSDADGYPDSANPTPVVSTTNGGARPDATYVRKNFVLTNIANADCAPTNPGPCVVTGFTVTAASSSQINLSWTAPGTTNGPAATGYDIYYCSGASCTPSTLKVSNQSATTYSNTSLAASTTYGYYVAARNAAGVSASSGNSYATTNAASTLCTGGTITTDGSYTVHKFTSSGTLNCNTSHTATVLVVGGGGGGCVGGGGAGGYIPGSLTVNGSMPVTVGAGGTGCSTSLNDNTSGENSVFSTLTAIGGGRGGRNGTAGVSGGSGGGSDGANAGASGTSGQGNGGGAGRAQLDAGGGGGAGGVGQACTTTGYGGNGGAGQSNSISGSSVCYAGGGGGGSNYNYGGGSATCGGGSGIAASQVLASGTANTGGGGGLYRAGWLGGTGGSGVVIIRYLTAGG